jgi:2-keto-3-deoxy-L-rhamnonate aldolase RhmA
MTAGELAITEANRYAEQGATIVTAAVDTSVLTDTVAQQLALVRASPARR